MRCPVAATLELVGDRWTLLIVRDLLRGRKRFNELRMSVDGIPPAVLAARLRALEGAGVVDRRPYQDRPVRYEYRLTPKGHALGVVVGALADWGQRYADADLALVDRECGHGVSVVYHCPTCERQAPRRRVRLAGRGEPLLPPGETPATLPG